MPYPLPVLTPKETRQSELNWSAQHGQPTWVLMQRAAIKFVEFLWPRIVGKRVSVFVGCGNNGGDGYLIAKLLLEKNIAVKLYAPFGDPAQGLDAYQAKTEFIASGGIINHQVAALTCDVAVDALFGSGLNRVLSTSAQALINSINQSFNDIYAVDVPSGLNAETGHAMPVAIHAKATLSFIALKPGLLTAMGPSFCGELTLNTLEVSLGENVPWQYQPELIEFPIRIGNTYKSKHGEVTVVAGRPEMAGAAYIAAKAALYAGAGRVFLHGPLTQLAPFVAATPELMVKQTAIGTGDLVVIGPGLGRDENAKAQLLNGLTLAQSGVLDADALRLLSELNQPDLTGWVLTPHEGEAAALLAVNIEDLQANRAEAAVELANKFKTTVVLKGAGSLVSSPSRLVFCHAGSPAMATPGMGDCLAGIIASLMAQGMSSQDAAIAGVNWHAQMGAQLATHQRVVMATDIIRQLKQRVN